MSLDAGTDAQLITFAPFDGTYPGYNQVSVGTVKYRPSTDTVIATRFHGTASQADTASYFGGWTVDQTASVSAGTTYVIQQKQTGSYLGVFYDYVVKSGSNSRIGEVFGTWNGAIIEYTEYSTVNIGNTDQVTMSLVLDGGNVQLLTNSNTTNWTIRAIGRYL